jgi:hypothetical protein
LPSATGYTFTFPNATGTLALTSDISYPVTSVFGRTGAVVATSGDYTTTQVTEGTNLYYTDVRARASNSFVAGSGAYNSTTGVITIPTDNSQIANGAGYITSSALSAYLPLTGGTLTGALNINVSSGTAMNVAGNAIFRGDTGVATPRQLIITSGGSTPVYLEAKGYGANYQTDFGIRTYNNVGTAFEVFYADSSGRVGINQVSPSYQLDVNGTGRFTGALSGTSATFSSSVTATEGKFSLDSGTEPTYTTGTAGKFIRSASGIYGGVRVALVGGASGGDNGFDFYNTSTLVGQFGYGAGGQQFYFTKGVNMATSSGSVGIGETAPNCKLDVVGASNASNTYGIITTRNSSNGGISFGASSTSYVWIQGNVFGSGTAPIALNASGGNVGIGTSSPSAVLDVAGKAVFRDNSSNATFTGGGAVALKDASGSPYLSFHQNTGARLGYIQMYGAGVAQFNVEANQALTISTNATERMRITSDGNLLLGTTDNGSGAKLVFFSTTAAQQLKAAGTAPAITFSNTITSPTIGGSLGACTSAGQFLSGTAAGDMILINQFTGNKLYITNYSGGVYLTQGATSWTANSDIRLKNINSHIENAVEKLSTLQTINFSYKDDKFKKQNLGLIAQEVEKIFPELIDKNGDGMLGVRYTELVPVLIKAVQELKAEIETLKNK